MRSKTNKRQTLIFMLSSKILWQIEGASLMRYCKVGEGAVLKLEKQADATKQTCYSCSV